MPRNCFSRPTWPRVVVLRRAFPHERAALVRRDALQQDRLSGGRYRGSPAPQNAAPHRSDVHSVTIDNTVLTVPTVQLRCRAIEPEESSVREYNRTQQYPSLSLFHEVTPAITTNSPAINRRAVRGSIGALIIAIQSKACVPRRGRWVRSAGLTGNDYHLSGCL